MKQQCHCWQNGKLTRRFPRMGLVWNSTVWPNTYLIAGKKLAYRKRISTGHGLPPLTGAEAISRHRLLRDENEPKQRRPQIYRTNYGTDFPIHGACQRLLQLGKGISELS